MIIIPILTTSLIHFSFKGLGEFACWAANLLLLPLSHNFRWYRAPWLKCVKTQTYALFCVVLNAVMLGPVLKRVRNYSTFSLTGYTKRIYTFCVLNRVRISLSRPNPPTYIPVEYTPPPPPPGPLPLPSSPVLPFLSFSLFPMGNTFVTNVLVPFSTENSLQTRTAERVDKCGTQRSSVACFFFVFFCPSVLRPSKRSQVPSRSPRSLHRPLVHCFVGP